MDMNQITLPCEDYDASVEFYVRLGLTQIVHSPPRYARFETPTGATLSIHGADAPSHDSDILVYFEVANVDETVDALKAAGIAFDLDPVDQSWLWREAHLRDPCGNRLCIYHAGENRRYPPWRIARPD